MKIPWRRERLPTSVFWPGESHGLYSPWGRKELDTTEGFSASLSHRLTLVVKNLPANPRHEARVRALGQEDPLEKDMAIHSIFLPGESHGQKSLMCYSPQSYKELDLQFSANITKAHDGLKLWLHDPRVAPSSLPSLQ